MLSTRVRLKFARIARELTESEADREWRRLWQLIDTVEGWLLPEEGRWLYQAARSAPFGSTLVEVGSYKGRSTCCLAAGCGDNGRVYAIDSFDGGPNLPRVDSLPEFIRNINRCGFSNRVEPIVGLSSEVSATWAKPIHLLFIDGSHHYEDVVADFRGFHPHLTKGAAVAFHDITNQEWPGVMRAWNEIKGLLVDVGHCGSLGYGRVPQD